MINSRIKYNTVTEYIENQAENRKAQLLSMRSIIINSAPNASEIISYGMPAYKIHSVLVYFAANINNIGFYPTSSVLLAFREELTNYKTSKGTIQFKLNEEIPHELVERIVKFRIEEDEQQFLNKRKKSGKKVL